MKEAVEIAKLRLFLKLVAEVDPSRRKKNCGLEPLPDIDFNIRSGNTLVGFATERQLEEVVKSTEGDLVYREKLEGLKTACKSVEKVYEHFQKIQTETSFDNSSHKESKAALANELKELDEKLNRYLAETYGLGANTQWKSKKEKKSAYQAWKESHQPFHWLAEFYGIISKGGFDVVIGNPPYVEYSKVKCVYLVKNYETESCGNLYALVIERCISLNNKKSYMGMIVQNSIDCTDRMLEIQNMLIKKYRIYFSNYDDRPAKLFDGMNHMKGAIFLSAPKSTDDEVLFSTKFLRWYEEYRENLFMIIYYHQLHKKLKFTGHISKYSDSLHENILLKVYEHIPLKNEFKKDGVIVYCHRIASYFIKATDFVPYFYNEKDGQKKSEDYKEFLMINEDYKNIILSLLNSTIFYINWHSLHDGYHCGKKNIETYPFSFIIGEDSKKSLIDFGKNISNDYKKNAFRKETQYKNTGKVIYDEFYPKKSKPIIDEIDKVLAKHYGFTEEELDFIINYDIKYRMGNELEGTE
jgi:hypothetical protein